ncbi:MAG: LysR family transcriptional regulator [Dehalococcoidia bacterium]|nr:LysR family transcriptional regulator [Dehalococcoidia bacterium]
MQIEWLRTFLTVAETGSLTEAAERLGLSQPAVSKQLQQFERYFNAELKFWRGREFRLTESGQDVLDWARDTIASLEALNMLVLSRTERRENTIIIASGPTLLYHYVPFLAETLSSHNPDWRISTLTIMDQGSLTQVVCDGAADIALHTAPYSDDRLECRPVVEDELVPVANPRHSLAGALTISAKELAEEPLLLLSGPTESRTLIDAWFAGQGAALRDPVEMGSQAEVRARLLATPSIGVVSHIVVARDLADAQLVKLDVPGFRLVRNIYASNRVGSNRAVQTAVSVMATAFAAVNRERLFGP